MSLKFIFDIVMASVLGVITFGMLFNRRIKAAVIGAPIPTKEAGHQQVGVFVGLAVLAADAISSVAYSTEAVLLILVCSVERFVALLVVIAALIALLAILIASYRKTIKAYPGGGGAYTVARSNLGLKGFPGLSAGASLLTDYTLTVAVSVSAGIGALTSAFPILESFRVEICILTIFFITMVNLRGLKDSSSVFAGPTYLFIFGMIVLMGYGYTKYFLSGGAILPVPAHAATEAGMQVRPIIMMNSGEQLFFFLRAFAAGCTALTGVEAISNGVSTFSGTAWKNAIKALTYMGVIMGVLIVGTGGLAYLTHALPSADESVMSQMAHWAVGSGPLYLYIQGATLLVLVFAANTAFNDFPRLASLMALDGYLPRQFASRGDRLAYSSGVVVLALAASALVIVFKGKEQAMLPLYAIGVFWSFTLSQFGMALKTYRDRGSKLDMVINSFGGFTTMVVLLIIAVTKWDDGAKFVLYIIPTLMAIFQLIKMHYDGVAKALALTPFDVLKDPDPRPVLSYVLVAGQVNALSHATVEWALASERNLVGLHIAINPERTSEVEASWKKFFPELPLQIIPSPVRSLTQPLYDFVNEQIAAGNRIHLFAGSLIVRWWAVFLHDQDLAWILRRLSSNPNVQVTPVRFDADLRLAQAAQRASRPAPLRNVAPVSEE